MIPQSRWRDKWADTTPQGDRGAGESSSWRRLVRRLALALALGLFLALAPIPAGAAGWLGSAQAPIAVLLTIILIGKALYDTFFWDRYPR